MDKRVLGAVIALVLVIGGSIGAFALSRASLPSEPPAANSPVDSAEPMDSATSTAEATVQSGSYVDYSDTAIADADGRILLFFHASWCGQCVDIDSDILTLGVPAGVTIIKVDYDSHQDLRQLYGVTIQTTFLELDAGGDEVQRFIAYDTPSLAAVIEAML